jgi:hypothetical protein
MSTGYGRYFPNKTLKQDVRLVMRLIWSW